MRDKHPSAACRRNIDEQTRGVIRQLTEALQQQPDHLAARGVLRTWTRHQDRISLDRSAGKLRRSWDLVVPSKSLSGGAANWFAVGKFQRREANFCHSGAEIYSVGANFYSVRARNWWVGGNPKHFRVKIHANGAGVCSARAKFSIKHATHSSILTNFVASELRFAPTEQILAPTE